MSSKMSSKRIVLVWPSGDVVCEGLSVLGDEPEPPAPGEQEAEEPCPPTKPSAGGSGIIRRADRAA